MNNKLKKITTLLCQTKGPMNSLIERLKEEKPDVENLTIIYQIRELRSRLAFLLGISFILQQDEIVSGQTNIFANLSRDEFLQFENSLTYISNLLYAFDTKEVIPLKALQGFLDSVNMVNHPIFVELSSNSSF